MFAPKNRGFTLVELVAVMVITGILASVAISRSLPNTTFQLQAGRDLVVSALFLAQQKAMAQDDRVAVITSGSQIDVRVDSNQNGSFEVGESIRVGGTTYPLTLPGGVSLSAAQLQYDQLGHTTPRVLTVAKGSAAVTVTVSGAGYAR